MNKSLSIILISIACLLSSVTAISVALAIYALIDDKQIAVLFAGAAVLLDVFKYLAYPTSLRVLRGFMSALMLSCALILSSVSGWATYDRLMSAIDTSKAGVEARKSERLVELKSMVNKDSLLIKKLAEDEAEDRAQAQIMRDKGMVSKALELEESAANRASTQRTAAMSRNYAASLEITEIQSAVAKASNLPAALAVALCIGFALCLELVPALILSSVRCSKKTEETETTTEPVKTELKTQETAEDDNSKILKTLITHAKNQSPGTPIKLKDFAKTVRIGNLRAGQIFKQAEGAGAIKKTTIGYVAAA